MDLESQIKKILSKYSYLNPKEIEQITKDITKLFSIYITTQNLQKPF